MRVFLALMFAFGLAAIAAGADLSADEKKLQGEFQKAYRVNDKDARKSALTMMEPTKHPSSWAMVSQVASTDPEAEVRLAAFTLLAGLPARDASMAHQLASMYGGLKPNDVQARLDYAKAMAKVEFKSEIVWTIGDNLSRMRYPDVPPLIQGSTGGNNAALIENVKKQRKQFEDLLEAFNAIAQSEIQSPTKDSPQLMKTWLAQNQQKYAAADRELADKNKKEDAEAAKAAKAEADAAKAAKAEESKKTK